MDKKPVITGEALKILQDFVEAAVAKGPRPLPPKPRMGLPVSK